MSPQCPRRSSTLARGGGSGGALTLLGAFSAWEARAIAQEREAGEEGCIVKLATAL